MSKLVAHALRELSLIGAGENNEDYEGKLRAAVLEIVDVFSKQGHSGYSASLTVSMVEKLLRFMPLTPLTGEEDEWTHIDPSIGGDIAAQNKRCSRVFRRNDGSTFDVEGRVYREPDGTTYITNGSATPVTFPYTPVTEVVDVDG